MILALLFWYVVVGPDVHQWKAFGPFTSREACIEDIRLYGAEGAGTPSECYAK